MCNCIEEYCARLRSKNDLRRKIQIDTNFAPDGTERVSVCDVYKKVDRFGNERKSWTKFAIPAKYCPFCGEKY